MDFAKYISTPKETTETSPLVTRLKLTKGRLQGGLLYFPTGPDGKLHFQARIGIHQILPFNHGENFRLNDCVLPVSLGIDLNDPPFEIDLVTWNDSTLYDHAMTVVFYLDPKPRNTYDLTDLITQLEESKKV